LSTALTARVVSRLRPIRSMRPDVFAERRVTRTIAFTKNAGSSMKQANQDQARPPSFLSVLWSVLASMFGVQSARRREADFTHGKPLHYILVGLLVTVVFILTVWGVVKLVLRLAGV
jgi:hypothetical protein